MKNMKNTANLLKYVCAKNYQNREHNDIAKIKQCCSFLASHGVPGTMFGLLQYRYQRWAQYHRRDP